MSFSLATFLSYILLYRYTTLIAFVFIGAFLLPLPVDTMLFAVGAFASQGYFNVFAVFAVAYLTSVIADNFGYFLTYRYEEKILKIFKINNQSQGYLKTEKKLREYSGETIFFTRIAGPFGAIVNFLSGLIEVPFKKFLYSDLAGNLVDISFFTFAGYFLGNYWQNFLNNIQYFGWIVFLIFILTLFFRIYKRK